MSAEVTRQTNLMQLFQRIQSLIGADLRESDRIYHEELVSRYAPVNEMVAHLRAYQGKRLRPILLLLAGAATGILGHDHRVLAAVVEMIHTATLVHDDILDRADTRRHTETSNRRFGTHSSVLLGDYLFTHAFHLASSLESTFACRLIGWATNRVCEGEMVQIRESGNLSLTEREYFQIIDGKTAELCALCGLLGAHTSGSSEVVVEALESYGRNLGVAFQIADDILDVIGDEKETGKTLGTDLHQKKLTLPVIHWLETSPTQQERQHRVEMLRNGNFADVRRQLIESGSISYSQARGEEIAYNARMALGNLPESPARELLVEMTHYVMQRST